MSERASGAPRVGVLALQGDFALHQRALEALACEAVRVSLPEHLHDLDALILPGGESSTMLRLLDHTKLREPVARFVRARPVLGTCAGLILLSTSADKLPRPTFAALDIDAVRNGYGRQVHSFTDTVSVAGAGEIAGVFIRAPRLTRIGRGVEVIATRTGDDGRPQPVGVRAGRTVAIAFHPELTGDLRVHGWFLRDVAGLKVAAREHADDPLAPTPAAAPPRAPQEQG